MKPAWLARLGFPLSLLGLAGSVVMTAQTLNEVSAARASMGRRAKDLEALAGIRTELAAVEAARAAFEACRAAPPAPRALAATMLPELPAPELRDFSEPGPAGWQRRRQELSFDGVAVGAALKLVVAAEQPLRDDAGHTRPGWRLVQCAIRPAPGRPGFGRVVLVLEALVRE